MPIVISVTATAAPASSAWGSAKVRRMKPPGVPVAKSESCVPMYVGAPGWKNPGSESFWTPP